MAILDICHHPTPVLSQPARPVAQIGRREMLLARDMVQTMYAANGIGLAAPQVGRSCRLFVASADGRRGHELIVFNPRITRRRGRAAMQEGCLSLPGIYADVPRAKRVRLTGQDPTGQPIALDADGLLAIIIQHEVDHLRGRLFVHRLSLWHRRRLLRAWRQMQQEDDGTS